MGVLTNRARKSDRFKLSNGEKRIRTGLPNPADHPMFVRSPTFSKPMSSPRRAVMCRRENGDAQTEFLLVACARGANKNIAVMQHVDRVSCSTPQHRGCKRAAAAAIRSRHAWTAGLAKQPRSSSTVRCESNILQSIHFCASRFLSKAVRFSKAPALSLIEIDL